MSRIAPWMLVALTGGLAFAAAASSCAIEGFDLVDDAPPIVPPGAGGAGGVSSAGGNGGDGASNPTCGSKQWPSPPVGADNGGDIEFVVAVQSVDFGEGDVSNGPLVGYDLDSRCSCIEDGQSCVAPNPEQQSCDGPDGVDNAIADLFAPAALLDPGFGSDAFTTDIGAGAWSVLLRVEGYNGEADDGLVTVTLYPSGGLDKDPCNSDQTTPNWDGMDAWPVGISALADPGAGGAGGEGGCGSAGIPGYSVDDALYVDTAAYVRDSVMVASLPDVGLAFDDGAEIKLSGGFVTGRIVADGGDWRVEDGLLAGRWALTDVFETLAILGSDGEPRCTDDQTYQTLRDALCNKRDLTAGLAGPTATCDAVSFGMAFEALPAQLGFIYDDTGGGLTSCPPNLSPANDSCPE